MNPNRQFKWISSKTGDPLQIKRVHEKLYDFYSKRNTRHQYQTMLDSQEGMPEPGQFVYKILTYIMKESPNKFIEIGCGSGRIYRQLCSLGFKGDYTGIEVADYVIQNNLIRHPNVDWKTAGAYGIPYENETFDMTFAYFVLEHLVYPEKALIEMMRITKCGGRVVLVFPDFVASGKLPSQELGLSHLQNAKSKIKAGRIFDAFLSLYDSRVRLRNSLRNAHKLIGEFPINTNLVCLNHDDIMGSDIDAVYIASKNEIADWAVKYNFKYSFPCGIQDEFNDKAFIVIEK